MSIKKTTVSWKEVEWTWPFKFRGTEGRNNNNFFGGGVLGRGVWVVCVVEKAWLLKLRIPEFLFQLYLLLTSFEGYSQGI